MDILCAKYIIYQLCIMAKLLQEIHIGDNFIVSSLWLG